MGMKIDIRLPHLHAGEREVWESDARFKVLACGRRWGKTFLGALACVACGLQGGRAWWVAPTYPIASIGWRVIQKLSRNVPGTKKSESQRMITYPGGGWVQVKSADNPDSLRGVGLDLAVLDEAAFMREEAWTAALRPALSDRNGKAIFISTPKGRNWFWRAFQRGQAGEAGWQSWWFPTASNPYIPQDEIENARRTLPELVFRQEYLAEFIEDAGMVFRRVMDAAVSEWRDAPEAGHQYVFGVDWGKHNDWTVIQVLDVTAKRLVRMERFNRIDYAVQVASLRGLYERFQPVVVIAELNAMGEPIVEQLQRAGLPVRGFTTTAATKAAIIESLQLAIEQQELKILNDPVLIGELQAYQMERLPSGAFRYSAPEGMHDDCVMALALAWYGASQYSTPAIIEV